jgi:hypothetical protein
MGCRYCNTRPPSRFRSYLRGRDAIAALFPDTDASRQSISYSGSVTLFGGEVSTNSNSGRIDTTLNKNDTLALSDAGIHTDFGG